jgi:fructose-1,6-bisphosphatase II / sedoheptulose-1,7-bisphosphatase
MQGRLMYEERRAKKRARQAHGPSRSEPQITCEEMAKGDVMFAATGVTSGTDAARRQALRRAAPSPIRW